MPTTKNLGIVRALHVGLTAPSNTKMMWYDDNPGVKILKYYDNVTSTWKTFDGYGVFVEKTGDTMTGPLTLPFDPILPLQAVTKQYVDNLLAGATSDLSSTLAVGNTTGGHDIVVSIGDGVAFSEGAGGRLYSTTTSAAHSWSLPDQSGTLVLSNPGTINRVARYNSTWGLLSGVLIDDGQTAGIGNLQSDVTFNVVSSRSRGIVSITQPTSGTATAVSATATVIGSSTATGTLSQGSGSTTRNVGVEGVGLGLGGGLTTEVFGILASAGNGVTSYGIRSTVSGNNKQIGILGVAGFGLNTDQRTIGVIGAVNEGFAYDINTHLLNSRNIKAAVVGHYHSSQIATAIAPRYAGYFYNNYFNQTENNYGVYAEVKGSSVNNFAVYALVSVGGNAGDQIAGKFEVASGTFKYALQLVDGSETTFGGKFLKDTGQGKARWTTITAGDISGIISGSGANNHIALWSSANTITSSPVFTYNTAFGSITSETSETKTSIGGYNAGIKTNSWTDFSLSSYYSASSNVYSRLMLVRGRGTYQVPTGALNGDILSDILTRGHGGNDSFVIRVTAAEDITQTGGGVTVDFRHAAVGQTSAYAGGTVKMQFTSQGRVRFHELYTIPNTQGGAAQALLNDGAGNLYWGTVAVGSGVTGAGQTDYVARWTSASTVGYGVLQDNGIAASIGAAPSSTHVFTVSSNTARNVVEIANTFANTLANQVCTALSVRSTGANTAVNGSNRGINVVVNGANLQNIGIRAEASSNSNNIAGLFYAAGGTTNYAIQLVDGTQGEGRFLKSIDGNGYANWTTINEYILDPAPASNDYLMTYDISTGYHKKIEIGTLLALGGGGVGNVDGSGLGNFGTRWIDTDTLGYGVIQDNGSKLAFGNAAFSTNFFLNSLTNTFRVGARFRVEIPATSLSTTGLIGESQSITTGDFNMGVSGIAAGSDTLNVGTQGVADFVSATATNIGGEFAAQGGLNNYVLRLVAPGNDALGKVLYSYTVDGKANWKALTGADILNIPATVQIMCSDMTTGITSSATPRAYWHAPCNGTITEVLGRLYVGQTSGNVFTVNVYKNGVSIFSTAWSFTNGGNIPTAPAVIGTPNFVKGDLFEFTVTQAGDGTAKGLQVTINFNRS